jgi:hypothetical protein
MKDYRSWFVSSLLLCGAAAADPVVTCTQGCASRPGSERTPTLLVLDDGATQIELTWRSSTAPSADEILTVRGGIPEAQDNLADLGKLEFTHQGDAWVARRTFSRADLGNGTFIVVTLGKKGARQRIVDWRPFYIRTLDELEAQSTVSEVTGGHSIDLIATRLQVTSGHGELPNFTGGDERVWWNLPSSQANAELDIDGENTGVPGLKITTSPVWESQGTDWRKSVTEHMPKVLQNVFDSDDPALDKLKFHESPDTTARFKGQAVDIKHYYGVITLFTNATKAVYRPQDLGRSGNRRYFAHETAANFRQKVHPKLWSSYSRRQYSGDAALLDLIASTFEEKGSVPGLSFVQLDDGDGGDVVYKVAFKARVAPWNIPDDARTFAAGFVHVDVVAVNAGFGGVDTQQDVNNSGICKLIRCDGDTKIDVRKLPRGWTVVAPTALTGTHSGTLQYIKGEQLFAQRSDKPAGSIELPSEVEFAVAAFLRAGALVKKGGFFGPEVEELVPLNSYVQFAVKYTVAMVPKTELVVSDEAIVPKADEFDVKNPVPEDKSWWQKFRELIGTPGLWILGIVLLVLAGYFLPPVAAIFRAVARLIVAFVDWLRERIKKTGK